MSSISSYLNRSSNDPILDKMQGLESCLLEQQVKFHSASVDEVRQTYSWVNHNLRHMQDQIKNKSKVIQERWQLLKDDCQCLRIRIQIAETKEQRRLGLPPKPQLVTEEMEDLYQGLKVKVRAKDPIYLKQGDSSCQESIIAELGSGGCKRAIQLSHGRALLIPNMDTDSLESICSIWKRVVEEEVSTSQEYQKAGLLTTFPKQVAVSLSADSHEGAIPALLCESFENLGKTKNWYILDQKNSRSSTWIYGKDFLFKSEEDRLKKENWDQIFHPLLDDIVKICLLDLPDNQDSQNIAIVKRTDTSTASLYEVRYLGFDFTHKHGSLGPLTKDQQAKEKDDPMDDPLFVSIERFNRACSILKSFLPSVMGCEFGYRFTKDAKVQSLYKRLEIEYKGILLDRIDPHQLIKQSFKKQKK